MKEFFKGLGLALRGESDHYDDQPIAWAIILIVFPIALFLVGLLIWWNIWAWFDTNPQPHYTTRYVLTSIEAAFLLSFFIGYLAIKSSYKY